MAGRRRARRARSAPSIVERADYVCFTGSTATGRLVAQGCAERLIGCSLELGGKNPLLVLRDADLERAAEGAVRAAFSNAGQLCVSMERLFVADQVYDRFVERFVARTEAMTLGASLDWGDDMGSLISQEQLDTVTAHVEDAVAKGARVLTGGRARPDLGPFFFEPTILEGVTPEMTCFGQETFGPGGLALPLPRRGRRGRPRQRGGVRPQRLGLQPGRRPGPGARPPDPLRHRQRQRGVRARPSPASTPRWAACASPGMGRRQGAEGILRYTETQSVATQRLVRFAPMLGMSEETYAKVMTANLRLMKKLGRA